MKKKFFLFIIIIYLLIINYENLYNKYNNFYINIKNYTHTTTLKVKNIN